MSWFNKVLGWAVNPVQLNSGSRAQDRFNKVQLNKDLMIRESYWTTNEPTQNQANSGKLRYIYCWSTKYFTSEKQDLRFVIAQLAKRCASDKFDPRSILVWATPNHVIFLSSFCPHPLFRILGKSLLNHYRTSLNQGFNSTQQGAMISWFVNLAQLNSENLMIRGFGSTHE